MFRGKSSTMLYGVVLILTVLAIALSGCGPSATPSETVRLPSTSTFTPGPMPSPTFTSTPTLSPTFTSTPTPLPTATSTPIPSPTFTSTSTPSPTFTSTSTPLPTATSTPTPTCPKGASLAGYWHGAYESPNAYAIVDYLHSVGANSVAVITSWYQETPASVAISLDPLSTPTDNSLEAIIDYIHSLSMTVLLKPHVEVQTGEWRANLQPSDLDAWFNSFSAFILHYAQMAEKHNVEIFCVGTEMISLTDTDEKRQHWADLVQQVRQVFSGKVTYSAHEHEVLGGNRLPSSFWGNFDYAATTVYYPLSEATTPTIEELLQAWPVYGEKLDTWQAEHQKPVIFGEIGYRSLDQCAKEPWAWWDLSCNPDDYNGECQTNAYEAALRYLCAKPWLKGLYWWQFEPQGTSDNLGACQCNDYSPACKPAGSILAAWYGGTEPAELCRPMPMPSLPVVDAFDYETDAEVRSIWQVEGTGSVTLTMDSSVLAPATDSNRSMRIESHVPCADPRWIQLVRRCWFPQKWSAYSSLELWVKVDTGLVPPNGGEFSIVLVDKGSSQREIWQATNWLDPNPEWVHIEIPLDGHGRGDPFALKNRFVIPFWEWGNIQNEVLDLDDGGIAEGGIAEVRIKALSGQDQCSQHPGFAVWIDQMQLK